MHSQLEKWLETNSVYSGRNKATMYNIELAEKMLEAEIDVVDFAPGKGIRESAVRSRVWEPGHARGGMLT